ncbi:redoxin domain-containing protein [bacterium]|nr:redoxin domain-containing protein [bacterium]
MQSYQDFRKAGAEVLGCSADSPATNKSFGEKLGAKFPLLTDGDWELRLKLGTPEPVGKEMMRITWVVDGDGVIRLIYYYEDVGSVKDHVEESLKAVKGCTPG